MTRQEFIDELLRRFNKEYAIKILMMIEKYKQHGATPDYRRLTNIITERSIP